MNQINTIVPYVSHGTWVFDDPDVGLKREAFVSGADDIIDLMTTTIPNAERGFVMQFSRKPFPGHQLVLKRGRREFGGRWYAAPALGTEGWLCPALFRYFRWAPRRIYARFAPLKQRAVA